MKTKFKCAVGAAAVLWAVVLIQILLTRWHVSHTDFTQAFARNQVTVTTSEEDKDSRNTAEGNEIKEGVIPGNLSTEEKRELAESLFRQMGGGVLLDSQESPLVGFQKMAADFQSKGIFSESYVAYGYTNGIDRVRKVNGKSINLTVAMNYDEEKGITHVVMGSPLVNSDF